MSKRKNNSLGVDWFLPNKKGGGYAKRRFASTTVASNLLIEMLAEDGKTWAQIAESINFDDEAKAVAERFCAEGYGHDLALPMLSASLVAAP